MVREGDKISCYIVKLGKPLVGMTPNGYIMGFPRGANVLVSPLATMKGDIGVEDIDEIDALLDNMQKFDKVMVGDGSESEEEKEE